MDPRFEAVCSDEDSSFRCLHFSGIDFAESHGWHYHPEFELTWIIRSHGARFVGDSIERYGPGDLVLTGPNLPHCWRNEASGENAQSPELILVQFARDCLGEGFLALPQAAGLARLLNAADCGLSFSGPAVGRVGELLRMMTAERGLVRTARLIEILNVLAECNAARPLAAADYHQRTDINPVSQARIDTVRRYVRENLDGDIRQAEIASALGLSSPAFSRFFKGVTGKTFVSFVNTLRVDQACRLMQNPQISITQAAMSCGYHNISNFNRQFLAIKGMNPTEYRYRLRERRPAPLPRAIN